MTFLRILSPFYFIISAKLVADGVYQKNLFSDLKH